MKTNRIFWGLFFILGAVFLIASKLGYLAEINIFGLVLTVLFVAIIIKSVISRSFSGIFFPAAFILMIYDKPLGIEALTPWTVLAAALFLSIGCSMLFGKKIKKTAKINHHGGYNENHDENFDEIIDEEDGENVSYTVKWGSGIKYVNSSALKKVNLKCDFGAMKVYLDNAKLQDGTAELNLDLAFGGIELYVPKEWYVENQAAVTLAGVEEKNRNAQNTIGTLIVKGNISFAGVTIIYI